MDNPRFVVEMELARAAAARQAARELCVQADEVRWLAGVLRKESRLICEECPDSLSRSL